MIEKIGGPNHQFFLLLCCIPFRSYTNRQELDYVWEMIIYNAHKKELCIRKSFLQISRFVTILNLREVIWSSI